MSKSKIEWTDDTWNPVTGCTKVSGGCQNCYAERMAKRLAGRVGYPADDPFRVTAHEDKLGEPLRWRKPRTVFVCSMGDLFHEDVPFKYLDRVFAVMALTPHCRHLLLTKRPERMREYFQRWREQSDPAVLGESYIGELLNGPTDNIMMDYGIFPGGENNWRLQPSDYSYGGHGPAYCEWVGSEPEDRVIPWPLPNVGLGVSIEDQATADERIPTLLNCPAAMRFVSYEPALGGVDLEHTPGWLAPISATTSRLDWVICGGESGPGARPMHPDWARSVRDQCQVSRVPFFFKQWGGVRKKKSGRLLDGRTWDERPERFWKGGAE